jgi:hypothetical protein
MIIDNKPRVSFLKRLFYIGCLLLALVALIFILLGNIIVLYICCGILFFWYLFFRGVDFQYVEYSDDDKKILVRYYPVIKFGTKDYNSIEFLQSSLYEAKIKKSVFGLISDLSLAIKTKRGIAEYPTVSLTAMPQTGQKRIDDSLQAIIKK